MDGNRVLLIKLFSDIFAAWVFPRVLKHFYSPYFVVNKLHCFPTRTKSFFVKQFDFALYRMNNMIWKILDIWCDVDGLVWIYLNLKIFIIFIFVICGLLITVEYFYIFVTVHNGDYH